MRLFRIVACPFVLAAFSAMAVAQGAIESSADSRADAGSEPRFITDVFSYSHADRPQIELDGTWDLERDPDGKGKAERWHEGEGDFTERIRIPGAPQAQGIGEPHPRQKTHFMEPFWVRRSFATPEIKSDQRVWLRIGGIAPAADIYLNGVHLGYTKSSRTQQRVDVTPHLSQGDDNLIAIHVREFPEIRLDGIWEMAECAMNWTGVYRPIRLEIAHRVSVIDFYLQPDLDTASVAIEAILSGPAGESLRFTCEALDGNRILGRAVATVERGNMSARATCRLKEYTTWTPEHPQLYTLRMKLMTADGATTIDQVSQRFGMREISTEGTKILLNGRPIFIRAFGDDQYYPKTLCPPADKEWYVKRLATARRYGMNAAKGCVETLPQEYIEAADEVGILVIQEMPFGLSGLRENRYTIEKPFRDYYASELDGLVRQSRNHASVLAYSMSSEIEFAKQTQESFDFFSRDLVQQTRKLAPHALVIDCTGYLTTEQTDKGQRDTDFYASICPTWMKKVLDETPVATDRKHPTILHEYNWWSCYPDPADKLKYEDAQLKPFWLDTLVKTARENGQEHLIPTYRRNSLRLQAICRKDGIEYARRNPDVEGYILWLLIDFGQYSEGLLDDFWQPKNVTADEFLESNGDTVVVLATEGERCLVAGGTHRIPLAVSHYGDEPLKGCSVHWAAKFRGDGQQGRVTGGALACGELTAVGDAVLDLSSVRDACQLSLQVELRRWNEIINTNAWSFWVFPEVAKRWRGPWSELQGGDVSGRQVFVHRQQSPASAIPPNADLVIADQLDAPLVEYIEAGGRCLLFANGAAIENRNVYYGTTTFYNVFRTIPWNAGTSGNSGTVITPHPALEAFPHDEMCDLQFVWLFRDVLPMEFEPLREFGVEPIIRMIDHYAANRNNAHLLEFRVGKGSVLATTLNVLPNLENRIEARYLLECLVDYAVGPDFDPKAAVPREAFAKWFSPSS